MPTTRKQAELIGKKCYIKSANQKHCEDWCYEHLSPQIASTILGRVLTVNYDMCMKHPEKASEITAWGREQIKALGYEEPQFNRSV